MDRYLAQLGLLKYRTHTHSGFARTRQKLIRKVFEIIRGSLTSRREDGRYRLSPPSRPDRGVISLEVTQRATAASMRIEAIAT